MPFSALNLSGLEIFIAPWIHSTFPIQLRVTNESVSLPSIYVNELSFKMEKKSKNKLGLILEYTGSKFAQGNNFKESTEIQTYLCLP